MKYLMIVASLLFLSACASIPEDIKQDGRAKAESSKQKAEQAYRDLEKEM